MASDPAPSAADVAGDGDPAAKALALTAEAEDLLGRGQVDDGVRVAAEAANLGVGLLRTWLALARACEAQGDLPSALGAYEQAAAAGADPGEIAGGVGRVALRLGDFARAERLLRAHLADTARVAETVAQLAEAQSGLGAFDRAHATLRSALEADPGQSVLWSALGRLLCVEGRHAQSTVFFEEALRLDPAAAAARGGLADALLLGAGEVDRALALGEEAMDAATPRDRPAFVAAHARRLLAAGRLAEGWATLAIATDTEAAAMEVKVAAPRWTPDASGPGAVLLIGEDQLTDEILLAHVVPDLVAEGRPLILAVAKRWEGLARRSFPEVSVVPLLSRDRGGRLQLAAELDSPHLHGGQLVSAWRPLRSTLAAHRADASGFPAPGPYLLADPARVEHWRRWLAALGPGPTVGVRWRQPALDVARPGEVPSLDDLHGPLSAPGLHLVSLQEKDVMGETDWIRGAFSLEVHEPPGLDHDDLGDVAALACALDVVIGPPGLTTYLAAACGARTWFLSTPWHWALLGQQRYPWFPEAQVIFAGDSGWSAAMDQVGRGLSGLAGA